MGRVVLGRRRVRVDVACSAGGRKEQGRDYPRSAGECRGGSGTGGQQCARMVLHLASVSRSNIAIQFKGAEDRVMALLVSYLCTDLFDCAS